MKPILRLLIIIAVVALIVWALLAFVPLPYPFGTLIIAVAVIACIILAYKELGGPSL